MHSRWAALALVACGYPQPARVVSDADENADSSVVEIDANTTGWPTNGGKNPLPCTTAFDEDGDGRSDECDVCPLDADPLQADQDRDGIGDICDPHPMFAVERLAYFTGFNGTLASEGVKIGATGSFVVSSSLLQQNSTTPQRTMFLLSGGPWRRPTVELKIASMTLNGTNDSWYAGLYMLQSPTPAVAEPRPESIMCLARYGISPRFRMVRIRGPAGSEVADENTALTVGSSVTIYCNGEHLGELSSLAGQGADVAPNTLTNRIVIQSDPTDVEMVKLSLWTYYGQAEFSGIAVYETIYP